MSERLMIHPKLLEDVTQSLRLTRKYHFDEAISRGTDPLKDAGVIAVDSVALTLVGSWHDEIRGFDRYDFLTTIGTWSK